MRYRYCVVKRAHIVIKIIDHANYFDRAETWNNCVNCQLILIDCSLSLGRHVMLFMFDCKCIAIKASSNLHSRLSINNLSFIYLLSFSCNWIYIDFPIFWDFFREISNSQLDFFKMLDEKIENVSHNALVFISFIQARDYLYIYGNASNLLFPV